MRNLLLLTFALCSCETPELAPVELAPVELAPVELAPVEPTPVEPTPVEPTPVHVAPTKGWNTTTTSDDLSGVPIKLATLDSSNSHHFGPPYEGATFGHLVLRSRGKERDVMVMIDQGQIMCHSFDDCRIQVRFDDSPVQTFRGGNSSDHNPTVVFLSPAAKFMTRAAKAKRILVELTIYQEGPRLFKFEANPLPAEER